MMRGRQNMRRSNMKDKKVGIITLALTLIALGMILTLNNFLVFEMSKVLKVLAALSIIALGVEFIFMEWSNRRNEEKVRLKISGLCIVVLVIIYGVSTFIPLGIVINNDNVYFNGWSLFNHQYEYKFERTYEEDAENLTKFAVKNNYGDIDIVTTETTKVTVNAMIRIALNEDDEAKAEDMADEIINLKSLGDTVELSATKYYSNTVSIDYIIAVPSSAVTTISNGNGDIQIKGVKEVAIDNRYGDVVIQDIIGKVSLINKNGHITVKNVGDRLVVENSYGNVEASSIDGDAKIENKNGDIEVEGIKGDLDIDNQYDDIIFRDITGNVVIEHKNGDILGEQVGKSVEVNTSYSSVSLDHVEGDVDIETKNEKVTLTNIGGSVVVENEYGKVTGKTIGNDISIKNKNGFIKVEDVKGKVEVESEHDAIELIDIDSHIKVIQQYGNVTLENTSGDIDIKNKNGDIRVKNRNKALKNVDIENEYGDVSLDTPDKQEGKFTIYTKYGKIKTDKGLSISEDNSERVISETLGSGLNTISIEVNNGDITIE